MRSNDIEIMPLRSRKSSFHLLGAASSRRHRELAPNNALNIVPISRYTQRLWRRNLPTLNIVTLFACDLT